MPNLIQYVNPNTGLLLLLIFFGYLIYRFNKDTSSFDLHDLFADSVTGKLSTMKIAQNVALIVSTWAFIHLTLEDKLTEWFFTAYMTVWVAGYIAKGVINKPSNDQAQ